MLGLWTIASQLGAYFSQILKRKIIPYNPKLKSLANKLRKNMTYSEVKLWNELKLGQMMEYDFDRQRPLADYIVDFYCKDLFLAIEIDGLTHEDKAVILKDKSRQRELESIGLHFIRFNALDVVQDLENVLRTIEHWISIYEERNGVPECVLKKRNKNLTS